MPRFKITDSQSGKTVIVSGDSSPTDQDAEQIFHEAGLRNAAPAAAPPSMSLGDVAGGAAQNFIPSAVHLGENIYSAVRHPADTATNIVNVGRGAGQELGHMLRGDSTNRDKTQQEQSFDAVKGYFGDRYGSIEGVKKAIATDPVGVMADASVGLGGTGAALRGTGTLGKVAAFADKAGEIANPIALGMKLTGKAAGLGGKGLSEILGVTTGAGGQSVRQAYGAGLNGGSAAEAFQAHLRGKAPIEDIVSDARTGLGQLRSQRGADYRAGIGSVISDPAVLDLGPIDKAVSASGNVNSFKGVDLSDSTSAIRQKIAGKIEQWRGLDPAEYHTAGGFDALKKSIGDIRDSAPYGTPERHIADQAYNAIKTEIVKQAPAYGDVMQDYAKASDTLKDVERTLSLGPNASADTSIRKLQSALRDNVNTTYGRRTDLANLLADNGAPNLMDKIAGQSLASPMSRGLGKLLAGGEIGGAAGALVTGHPGLAASTVPALALQSPRLMGEASYYTGKGANLGKMLAPKAKRAAEAALIADEMGVLNNNRTMPNAMTLGQLLQGAR